MLPSRGFEKGFVGQGRRGLASVGSGWDCIVTGQVGQSQSDHDVDACCIHALQFAVASGDSDTVGTGDDWDSMGAGDPGDADIVGEVVHNRVHYYVHVPNSEESAY